MVQTLFDFSIQGQRLGPTYLYVALSCCKRVQFVQALS